MSTSTASRALSARQSVEMEKKISESDWSTAYDLLLKPTVLGEVRIYGFSCITNRERAPGEDMEWCEHLHGNIFAALLCSCDFAIHCAREHTASLRTLSTAVAIRWAGADWNGGDMRENVMWSDKELPVLALQVTEIVKFDPHERMAALEEKKRQILWYANLCRENSAPSYQNPFRSPVISIVAPNKAERELILQKKAAFERFLEDRSESNTAAMTEISRKIEASYQAREGALVDVPLKKAIRMIRELRATLKAEV